MNDRDLLEMAAMAYLPADHLNCEAYMIGFMSNWNPLTDDGDALRLAVKLRLCVDIYSEGTTVCDSDHTEAREHGADNGLSTRRAIVRAAAAIGSAL